MNSNKERRTSQDSSASTRERRLQNMLGQYEISRALWDFASLSIHGAIFNIVIDDSGSMSRTTDVPTKNAHAYVRARLAQNIWLLAPSNLTRWDEVEDRLHMMLDLCCYLPIEEIRLSFLNRAETTRILVNDSLDEAAIKNLHEELSNWFKVSPGGGTPLGNHMQRALQNTSQKMSHFFFSDGEPSDCGVVTLLNMVCTRARPELNAITFVSCSDNDDEIGWMKDADERAPRVAEIDDFATEKREVQAGQGPGFPFSRGVYLMCLLCASCCKELDDLDEATLLTPQFLSIFFDHAFTRRASEYYFDSHPSNLGVATQQLTHRKQQWMSTLDRVLQEQNQARVAPSAPNTALMSASASASAASAAAATFFATNSASGKANSMLPVATPVFDEASAPTQDRKRKATEAMETSSSSSATYSNQAVPAPAPMPVNIRQAVIIQPSRNGAHGQPHRELAQETSFCMIM